MINFLDRYKFLKPAKRLRAKLKKEGWDRKYGGIQSEDDKVDSQFLTDNEARRRKLENRRTKSLLRSLFGGERIDEFDSGSQRRGFPSTQNCLKQHTSPKRARGIPEGTYRCQQSIWSIMGSPS